MNSPHDLIFRTPRLSIRLARPDDAPFFHRLWQNGRVMGNVGFPDGLGMSLHAIEALLIKREGLRFGGNLVAELPDGTPIGEAYMGEPDDQGVARTDIKLLPEFWGNGYGREIKAGLVRTMLAERPDIIAIMADPRRDNLPSIRMQEHVGAMQIKKGSVYPIDITPYLPDEEHALYIVFRPALHLPG